jgi:CheY-like chemotaxis protein
VADDAQARGINYRVEMGLGDLPMVRGSASELREVFVNIILNALDAMPQGGRLRIRTKVEKSVVKVDFTDSGIGMTEEVRARIFEPFFTTKSVTGTGLGLAVSHSIIERHGGRLEASSDTGVGSTFSITLPIATGYLKRDSRERTVKVDGAQVLVIDDDDRVREALVGMLGSAAHSADQAASGREGISKMEEKRFDLVLTDLSMPEMDGWAVAKEIRSRWPGTKIVLITGHALPPEETNHNGKLVDEIIFKPIQFDDISLTINSVLA